MRSVRDGVGMDGNGSITEFVKTDVTADRLKLVCLSFECP
jgi:hypothetical protein